MLGTTVVIALATLVAGGFAAVVRYGVTRAFAGRGSLPWAVLVVNIVGSAVGGATVGLAQAGALSDDGRLMLLGGVAGGLTTFSTWSVETMELVMAGRWRTAVASVALNLVAGLAVAATAWAVTH
jgi:CrcB protein